MRVEVRKANLKDVKPIVKIHRSDVKRWYKLVQGKPVEASCEELTVEERFRHGGPWRSVETCRVQLSYIMANNHYPIVVEVKGKVIHTF